VKSGFATKHEHVPQTWTAALVQPKQWKRYIRFGTWIDRSLYMSGLFVKVARELAICELDLVCIEEVR
jgi:hypothetical protein